MPCSGVGSQSNLIDYGSAQTAQLTCTIALDLAAQARVHCIVNAMLHDFNAKYKVALAKAKHLI